MFRAIFEQVADEMDVYMNYKNLQDHQSRAERNNRTIKKNARVILHRMGYQVIPRTMIQALVEYATEQFNIFPSKHRISSYYSLRLIMTQQPLEYNKHCKYKFGEYVQAHHQNQPTNTMAEQKINTIYLRPSNNTHGRHVLMNLNTGEKFLRGRVTAVPLMQAVKDQIEELAKQQGITSMKFRNKRGKLLPNSYWEQGEEYEDNLS